MGIKLSSTSGFARSQTGSIAIMTALFLTIAAPATIAVVDLTSISSNRDRLHRHLDRTLLTVARNSDEAMLASDTELDAYANRVFQSIDLNRLVDNGEIVLDVTYDSIADKLDATVKYRPKTLFTSKVLDIDEIVLNSQVTPPEVIKLEIALSLDVSGSMRYALDSDTEAALGSRRIDAMQDGVDALLAAFEDEPRLDPRISVVPYSSSVDLRQVYGNEAANASNVFKGGRGKTLSDYGLGNNPLLNFLASIFGWKTKTSSGKEVPKGVWAAERLEPNASGKRKFKKAKPGVGPKASIQSQPSIRTACDAATVDYWAAYGYVQDDGCIDLVARPDDGAEIPEINVYAPREGILPLSEPTAVETFMAGLEPEGGTAIHLGTEWALYSLLPDWHSMFKHPDGPPADFTSGTRKVLVVMTDGDLSQTQNGMTVAEGYDYLQEVCTAARDMGVEVHAIGLRVSTTTDTELTACAGSVDRYYPVSSRSGIEKAFEDIAKTAIRMHISG